MPPARLRREQRLPRRKVVRQQRLCRRVHAQRRLRRQRQVLHGRPHPLLLVPGLDLMHLYLGKKVFGNILILKFLDKI
jgi:hypothetical protein